MMTMSVTTLALLALMLSATSACTTRGNRTRVELISRVRGCHPNRSLRLTGCACFLLYTYDKLSPGQEELCQRLHGVRDLALLEKFCFGRGKEFLEELLNHLQEYSVVCFKPFPIEPATRSRIEVDSAPVEVPENVVTNGIEDAKVSEEGVVMEKLARQLEASTRGGLEKCLKCMVCLKFKYCELRRA